LQHLLDNRLSLRLDARFEMRDYSISSLAVSNQDLADQLIIGNAGVGVRATDWLSLDLAYRLTTNLTDDQFAIAAIDPTDPTVTVLRGYIQHLVTLSTTLKY
jgi:hypothetical protein